MRSAIFCCVTVSILALAGAGVRAGEGHGGEDDRDSLAERAGGPDGGGEGGSVLDGAGGGEVSLGRGQGRPMMGPIGGFNVTEAVTVPLISRNGRVSRG